MKAWEGVSPVPDLFSHGSFPITSKVNRVVAMPGPERGDILHFGSPRPRGARPDSDAVWNLSLTHSA